MGPYSQGDVARMREKWYKSAIIDLIFDGGRYLSIYVIKYQYPNFLA
ncbi:hypothetical protein [Okeania sp. SIO1I7]|nr:hypothetical protein [Okeania sp. SIO1I7]NET28981.1 hypothetical protein [Okeania sp. SIO1I7]